MWLRKSNLKAQLWTGAVANCAFTYSKVRKKYTTYVSNCKQMLMVTSAP